MFELKLTLPVTKMRPRLSSSWKRPFQNRWWLRSLEFEELVGGEVFGGYVRYDYDQFDGFAHPYVPIFSRAYFFDGTQEDFDKYRRVEPGLSREPIR